MQANDFMSAEEHFNRLVDGLPASQQTLFHSFKHLRVETAYKRRTFIVYEMINGVPVERDHIVVNDFIANDKDGATTELESLDTQQTIVVSYSPVRLFGHEVFVWIPLHAKIRWGAVDLLDGSLGFPICIRTRSRFNLREPHVTYCETGVSFGREFDDNFKG